MPNWCFTSYVFEGKKEEIADLYHKLQSLDKLGEPLVKNDFGKLWLGCVVTLFRGDWNQIPCRGTIDSFEQHTDTTITLSTSTAWGDIPQVWDFVCKQYPSIKYYFSAEESGNGYYATNDTEGKFFTHRFLVEQDNEDAKYYETEEQVFADISKRLGVPIASTEDMKTALETHNKAHEDDWISVYKFEII